MAHRLTWLDVFTARRLTGNALAVVHDADAVDEQTMLAFARETHQSETTFVQGSDAAGADYRNRIWTMGGEIDFAGHPSLGTAVAVALARGETDVHYVQETRAGLQPIDVELTDGGAARAWMLQEPAVFGAEVDPARALEPLGLRAGDVHPELPVQVVATGATQLLIPVADAGVLDRPAPTFLELHGLLTGLGCLVAYLFYCWPERELAQARGYFTDSGELTEDPATGSAAGPLMAYLSVRTGAARVTVEQGVAMGRPSRLLCEAGERVRVGGDAVVVAEGTVTL